MNTVEVPPGGTQRIRPSRWYAALAIPVLLAGFFFMGLVLWRSMDQIAKNMARQVLPDPLQAQLQKGRTYTIFLEQSTSTPVANSFGFHCEVRTVPNGAVLKLKMPAARTWYIAGRSRGVAMFEFDVPRDSNYQIACEVWDLPSVSKVAIAVGTGVKDGISSAILLCYFIGATSVLIALVIFIRVLMLRDQSKREIRSRGRKPI
jgi:hypothetical protein